MWELRSKSVHCPLALYKSFRDDLTLFYLDEECKHIMSHVVASAQRVYWHVMTSDIANAKVTAQRVYQRGKQSIDVE